MPVLADIVKIVFIVSILVSNICTFQKPELYNGFKVLTINDNQPLFSRAENDSFKLNEVVSFLRTFVQICRSKSSPHLKEGESIPSSYIL
jgi:hypothetical protein